MAIAPAPSVRAFVPHSVAELQLPVAILTGGADCEAPSERCADWLVSQNDKFQRHHLGNEVGHYTFLDFPSDKSLIGKEDIFSDHESVDRSKVHKQTTEIVFKHFIVSESKDST
ncbi:MAG: hypothetical protein AAF498_03855 [Pseudomonadota bacterium]